MASTSSKMPRNDNQELLGPFIQALQSRQILDIPQETVLGAVTHFLSTLSIADLPGSLNAIVNSDHLWSSDQYQGNEIGQAVALAVSAKVARLGKRHASSWCSNRKTSTASQRWLQAIQATLEMSEARDTRVLELRAGLLAGIAVNHHVSWGDERVELEEEIVLAVSAIGLATSAERDLIIICDVVHHIHEARLLVLDLQTILPFIQIALLASLNGDQELKVKSSSLALALGRLFEVLSRGGSSDQAHLKESICQFVEKMRERAESRRSDDRAAGKMTDKEWNKEKTALFAFLVPTSAVIDILLKSGKNAVSEMNKEFITNLAIQIVATLAAFSNTTQQSEGGLEGHDRVLNGALDILVASDGHHGTKRLFDDITRNGMTSPRVAFVLVCGEKLVHELDGSTLREILLPLCHSSLHQLHDKAAFEAAHSFMVAIIAAAGQSDHRPLLQQAFAEEIIPYYTQLLMKQLAKGHLTADQFRPSYCQAVELASKVDSSLVLDCIDELNAPEADPSRNHTLLLTRISTAQYIPISRLRGYLDRLATDIAYTPGGEGRLELAAGAFGMVLRELGDEQKRTGIEWWMRRKAEIEGNVGAELAGPVRPKL